MFLSKRQSQDRLAIIDKLSRNEAADLLLNNTQGQAVYQIFNAHVSEALQKKALRMLWYRAGFTNAKLWQ